MNQITESTPPQDRLISPFLSAEAHYVDSFWMDVPAEVTLQEFIAAFYTTPLFRMERVVLRFAAKAPSTPRDVDALADGRSDSFAVWSVEGRSATDILLGDAGGRTKSWLCVQPQQGGGTRLWFGSVVVPVMQRGRLTLGPVFHALLRAHKVYSRMLLGAASARLR